jgi:excisionase family DNA binding protein
MAQEADRLLSPKEAAAVLGVGTSTIVRWAEHGLLTDVRTLGGHRRYVEREVRALALRQTRTQGRSPLA